MHTSTLMVERRVAQSVQWNSRLVRHQDWDFVLRLRSAGAHFVQLDQPLVDVHVGSTASISAGLDWRSSIDWIDSLSPEVLGDRARADLLVAQSGRYALSASEFSQFRNLERRARRYARPSTRAYLLALAGLFSRDAFRVALLRSR
jgi:hypothetical protein